MDGDCQASCQDGRDAVLLRNNACLGIQGLQQVRQASADAVSLRQGVTLAIGRSSLGVAHGVDAVFSRHIRFVLHRRSCSHIDLAIRDGRVHEAQLAQEQPNACARSHSDDHGPLVLVFKLVLVGAVSSFPTQLLKRPLLPTTRRTHGLTHPASPYVAHSC